MLTVKRLVVLDWGAINAEEIVDLLFDVAMSSDESATMIASTSNSKIVYSMLSLWQQKGRLYFDGLGSN